MRFLLESCLEIGLSAMITVLMMTKETSFMSFSDAFSTICAFLSLLALLLAPLYFVRVTGQHLRDVEEGKERMESRHAQLFAGYRLEAPALRYQMIFFLRRYFMLLILTLLPSQTQVQIKLQMLSTVYMASYIGA